MSVPQLLLTRWWTDAEAQLGRLVYPGGDCFTLEDRWLWNRVGLSCIPLGLYAIRRDTFRGKYENFAIPNVLGRTAIEMHRGNTRDDTEGCILLGAEIRFDPKPRLVHSELAFDAFMEAMEGVDQATLLIIDAIQRPELAPIRGES